MRIYILLYVCVCVSFRPVANDEISSSPVLLFSSHSSRISKSFSFFFGGGGSLCVLRPWSRYFLSCRRLLESTYSETRP